MLRSQGQWLYHWRNRNIRPLKTIFFGTKYLRRAGILIVALWSLFFLGALTLAISAYVSPQLSLSSKLKDRAQMHYIACAGIKKAIAQVTNDETPKHYALNELWSNDEKEFKEQEFGSGIFDVVGDVAGPQIRWGLVDEERKININRAPYDVLERFFEIAAETTKQEAEVIADSIIDWRDEDVQPRKFGAEGQYYLTLNSPYPCKDKNFEIIQELLFVKGMNTQIFNRIKDRITVYTKGPVNINTADMLVLKSLGLSDGLTEKIIHFRCGNDGIWPSDDDNVFISLTTVVSDLTKIESLSKEEIGELNGILGKDLISVESDNFAGKSIGKIKNRSDYTQINFVFERTGKVKYWREE